jgi:hypothetical protein
MINKLMKIAFIGCIVLGASVPAEAGLFDRILKRNGGRKANCCQPQIACAPAPCSASPCAASPCQTPPTCLQQYHKYLEQCKLLYGNDPLACAECRRRAALGYCECIRDPETSRFSMGTPTHEAMKIICPIPEDESCAGCDKDYDDCIAAGGKNCNRCWFACEQTYCQPPQPPLTVPNR